MGSYCGVILAAGVGARIHPISVHHPKPLLPVLNKPVIEHQLEAMREAGIEECVVVCGHLREKLEAALSTGGSTGVRIEFVQQDRPLGIAHALSKVEPVVDRPFVLFLGDIFYAGLDLSTLIRLFERRAAAAVLAVRDEPNELYLRRNYAVMLHESGMVRRVVEKPRHARTSMKGIGVYLFDLPIFDAVRRTPRTAMRNEYELTSSIQILIDDGYPVFPETMAGWDMNITTVDDLWLCNQRLLQASGHQSVVGRDVRLHPGASLDGSVIGDGAQIVHGIRVSRVVALPGATIGAEQDVSDVVASGDALYPVTSE